MGVYQNYESENVGGEMLQIRLPHFSLHTLLLLVPYPGLLLGGLSSVLLRLV